MIMSWDGTAIGRPCAGDRMLCAESIEQPRLGLGLGRQRKVDGHLVPVEVGVERRADERVDLDRLALDEHRLERLDAETVQGRRPVQEHRVLLDDLFEHVPHLRDGRAPPSAWRT